MQLPLEGTIRALGSSRVCRHFRYKRPHGEIQRGLGRGCRSFRRQKPYRYPRQQRRLLAGDPAPQSTKDENVRRQQVVIDQACRYRVFSKEGGLTLVCSLRACLHQLLSSSRAKVTTYIRGVPMHNTRGIGTTREDGWKNVSQAVCAARGDPRFVAMTRPQKFLLFYRQAWSKQNRTLSYLAVPRHSSRSLKVPSEKNKVSIFDETSIPRMNTAAFPKLAPVSMSVNLKNTGMNL